MIDTLFQDGTFKLHGANGREFKVLNKRNQYIAEPHGVKQAIKDNIQDIERLYNGKTEDIFALLAGGRDEEISQAIKDYKTNKNQVTVRAHDAKALQYIHSLLKLEFTTARNDKEKFIIYDPAKDAQIDYYSPDKIKEIFARCSSNSDQAKQQYLSWSEKAEKLCTKMFHQNKERLVPVDPDLNFFHYNLFRIPEYRRDGNSPPTDAEKKLFLEFMEHLIPDKTQRDYVYSWAYLSLVSRNETFLCLVGKHGVGKTMFMNFLSNLHGMENSVRPKDPKAQFNHYLSSKSLVIYDEVEIDDRTKETFKRIANKIIQVERKGHDQEDVTNTASIILATNYHYLLNMDPDDRRFSVPDLGDERLEKAFPGKAGKLHSMVADTRILRWFYDVLLETFEGKEDLIGPGGKFGPNVELKDTNTFDRCCRATAPDEIAFVIDLFTWKDKSTGEYKHLELNFEGLKEMYVEHIKKNNHRRRLSKYSLFYSKDVFYDKLKKYRVDGIAVAKVKKGKLLNNIALANE